MDADELTSLLKPGHHRTLVHRMSALNETERRRLAPTIRKQSSWSFTGKHDDTALALAVLGLLGGVRQIARAMPTHGFDDRLVEAHGVQVLRDRAPHWLPALPEALLAEDWTPWWRLVRAMVREGLVPVPETPAYAARMPNGLCGWRGHVLQELRADPGVLEEELWLMLAAESAGRSLAQYDSWQAKPERYPGGPRVDGDPLRTWHGALAALAAEGRIDRNRLLDAALAAPLRDWAAVDIVWFNRLHDALQPAVDEVVHRQATYARLLAVDHAPSVKLAQKQLGRLIKDPRLDPELVVGASRATLGRSDKATVQAQLRMLAALTRARPGVEVTPAVRVAVDHPRADVRDQAHKLLANLGAAVPTEPPPLSFEAPAAQVRPAPDRVAPVKDVDELADLFLRLVEEADDPIEVERLLDGVLRMAADRPDAGAVLLRRCENPEGYGAELRLAIAALAHVWLGPRQRWGPAPRIPLGMTDWRGRGPDPTSLLGVAKSRLDAIAQSVRSGPVATLALPTYADGTIDPDDLSERLSALGSVGRRHEPPAHEAELAVLRVPPERLREVVVPRRGRTAGVVATAIRRAGERAPRWERVTVQLAGRWQWEQSTVLVSFADTASSTRGDGPMETLFARSRPFASARRDHDTGEYETRFEQSLAWCGLLLPHHPDLFAAHVHPLLVRDLGKDRGRTSAVSEALSRSHRPTTAPECSALVLGLAAKDALLRIAAQDALLDLSRHGLLDGAGLGRQAAVHLLEGLVVGQRVVKGLAEVAREDSAALPVLTALSEVMAVLPGRRDAGAFLELAADLVERTGGSIALPAEFHELAAGRSASLLAKAARRLL